MILELLMQSGIETPGNVHKSYFGNITKFRKTCISTMKIYQKNPTG